VQLFKEHELVAVHCRLHGTGRRSTVDDHMPPDALAYKLRDPQWCLKQAEEIGPSCLALVRRLFAHRVLDNLRAAQGVIRLANRFGKTRLEAACNRANAFDSPRYRTVKIILENGQDQIEPQNPPLLPDIYTGGSRFQRDRASLLY
jgi:hypothetical protein